ncbi:MAG: serine/threonine-protein kinase [Gemmatimonadales bacterium]
MSAHERLTAALADRYRIEHELGQGGMATVYLAHDVKHDRQVAIKVLRPELAAVIGAERFLREIKTIATLQHPHILGLIDSGEVNGTAYYVMPFVEGESLRDWLQRDKQLPISDAVRLATEVAAALDYAHRHGVIHRDIKPENILVHDGSALVADFGIALAVSSAGGGSRMTETGMSLGTPHYMSPEQAMGEREITARSDVYALGAMTYEMLIGDPPFTGSTAQAIVAKVMTSEPTGLIAQRKSIPVAVEDAVLTALEKLPADRFGSAAEFGAALRHTGTTSASRITVRRGAAERTSRLSWLAALVALAVWMPNGSAVVYSAGDAPNGGLLMQSADARRAPDTLYAGPAVSWPTDVSRDGATLAFYGTNAPDENDLFFLAIADRSIRRVSRPRGQRGGDSLPICDGLPTRATRAGDRRSTCSLGPRSMPRWWFPTGAGASPCGHATGVGCSTATRPGCSRLMCFPVRRPRRSQTRRRARSCAETGSVTRTATRAGTWRRMVDSCSCAQPRAAESK